MYYTSLKKNTQNGCTYPEFAIGGSFRHFQTCLASTDLWDKATEGPI